MLFTLLMEARSLTPEEFREVISHFASGVTVITALHDGRRYGTTASAVTSLSLEPPMLLVCLNKESETGRAVAAGGHFGVNILGADQVELARRFARKGGDKFDGVPIAEGHWGEPLFDDALATLECRVAEQTAVATHHVFMAEVVSGAARTGTPLAYFRGQFGRLELTPDQLESD
jgi:flavin reductase (DIM6/NTAB) family NADH-FMN oxidoreductase RutF